MPHRWGGPGQNCPTVYSSIMPELLEKKEKSEHLMHQYTPYSPAMTQGSYSILKIDIDFWTQFLKEDLHEGNRVVHICKVWFYWDRTSATESVSNPEWLGWEIINKQTYFYLLPFLFY